MSPLVLSMCLGRGVPIPYIHNLNDDPIIELCLPEREREPVWRSVKTGGRILASAIPTTQSWFRGGLDGQAQTP
jgi:hypothetical protein